MAFTISWRLNDPSEEQRARWTKVHLVAEGHKHDGDARAICGLAVPDFPYDFAFDEAATCARCIRRKDLEQR